MMTRSIGKTKRLVLAGVYLSAFFFATAMETKPELGDRDRFAVADIAFQKRGIEPLAREALRLYRNYFSATPSDPEAGWRLAMACYFVGIRFSSSPEQSSLYDEGRRVGLSSTRGKASCAPCHFWTAINMALYAQATGIWKTLFSLHEIQKHLDLSIQNFKQAISVSPEEPLNFLVLAQFFLQKKGDTARAIMVARQGLALDIPDDPSRLESIEALNDLKHLLATVSLHPPRDPSLSGAATASD